MANKKASIFSPQNSKKLQNRLSPEFIYKFIERKWGQLENIIQIVFVIDGIIFPMVVGYVFSKGGQVDMLMGIITSLSFWILVICSVLLIRNAGKINKQQLDRIEAKLNKLDELEETNQLLRDLVNEIKKDREERNKTKLP